jgi:hypothetical protein
MTTTHCESPSVSPTLEVAPEPLAVLAARTTCALEQSIQRLVRASDENLGHLERQAEYDARKRLRQTIERGAQAKAGATPPHSVRSAAKP